MVMSVTFKRLAVGGQRIRLFLFLTWKVEDGFSASPLIWGSSAPAGMTVHPLPTGSSSPVPELDSDYVYLFTVSSEVNMGCRTDRTETKHPCYMLL
jgi:hypothetical protein